MSAHQHHARLTSAADLTPLLDALETQLGWSAKARFQIELALEELVVNTFTHGSTQKQTEPMSVVVIDISFEQKLSDLTITLVDNALAFDPTDFATPDVTLTAEDRKIGGLGLFLASKMMDTIQYKRVDGFNRVTMQKLLA